MQFRKITFLGSSFIALAQVASAQGFYADGGYTIASLDTNIVGNDDDDSEDLAFGHLGGHFGYEFSPYFSIEGEALFGVQDDSLALSIDTDDESVDAEVTLSVNHVIGAYARGNLPVGDRFTAFARAGVVMAEFEVSTDIEDVDSISDTDEAAALGIGGEFNFTESLYARGEYTRYEFESDGLNAISLGIGYRF